MHLNDSDFEADLILESTKAFGADMGPKDAYQTRRMIERRAEIKRLRELLEDPTFIDFD